ncbi:MAG: DUF488 domain-containing protein [Pseudomonadota bacterium]|nr:DUF488 domain-containing protein [Pseudomonadota bacterium]
MATPSTSPVFHTVGYGGRTVPQFVEALRRAGIGTLVDVRLLPLSRRKGFSKTALSAALADAGIAYVHLRGLGNPKENRRAAASVAECLAMYRSFMAPRWDEALAPLLKVVGDAPAGVALMCMEADPAECHRTVVAEEAARRLPGAIVRAL